MGRGEVKLKHKIIIGGFMKINKLSKIFALCLTGLMAFALIGCAQNSDRSEERPSGKPTHSTRTVKSWQGSASVEIWVNPSDR